VTGPRLVTGAFGSRRPVPANDLPTSIAACLAAHSMNVRGGRPVSRALTYKTTSRSSDTGLQTVIAAIVAGRPKPAVQGLDQWR